MTGRMIRGLAILTMFVFAAGSQVWAVDSAGAPAWAYDPQAPNAPCPSTPACGLWLQFRAAHPWPYQTFAVQEIGGDAVVIVSEPPPVLSREQLARTLKALFGNDLLEMTYNRWPTGLDGWLEDVVLRVHITDHSEAAVLSGTSLAAWKAPADVVDRLRLLYRMLHRTSDGFWLDRVTGEEPGREPIAELKIPVSDLAGWLAGDQGIWIPSIGQAGRKTTQELYSEKTPGVFHHDGGIVALVAPRGVKLADLAADFRRFAVESDLIVGAAGLKNGGLLLLGRSRQIAIATLPPLRFESLASFARNRAEHLSQSYERQRIFAGRVRTGKYAGWDWAPILLSPQLDDSEFGTLLNLADQILKSWSQHGQVEYYAFAYPKPATYPFGGLAASDYFAQKFLTTSLLFNWNTEELATITTVNGRDILTGDRTGALNVLYRPSDSIIKELGIGRFDEVRMQDDADARAKDAREYFATRGDPILVRVVQNVLLYQAAQTFLVVGDPQEPAKMSRSEQVVGVLEKRAAAWLSEITRGKTDLDRNISTTLAKFMSTSGFTTEKMARVLASPQSVERDLQRAIQTFRTSVSEVLWIPKYLAEADKKQRDLFLSTCNSVGGHIEKDLLGTEKCVWQGRFGDTAGLVFAAYDAFVDGLKKMDSDYAATKARLLDQQHDLFSLEDTYARAAEIAKKLSERSGGVDLDDVLRIVLETTSAAPVRGSIRTPSVVLSKNSADVESIGGHNIDLNPRRRLIAPTFEVPKRPGAPSGGVRSEMEPPRPELETLGVRRTGSLLDEMRAAANEADLKAERWTGVQVTAKGCQCDAVVVQGEDGVIYFVRNAPPPAQQAIFGKSGVIDALAGPPAVKVVRFENFPDSTVENIARSAALITDGPRDGTFDRTLDGIASLFKPAESGGRKVSVTIERVGKEPEILRLSEESGSMASPREPITWRASTVENGTPTRWAEIFGNEGGLDPATSDAVIVRIGGQQGTALRSLGVRVQVEPARRQGIVGRLRAIVEQWLGSQPVKPRPWADSLIDLREAIRRQLKPLDLDFYYKHNKAKIRAADAASPNGCVERRCAG